MNRTFLVPLALGLSGCGLLGSDTLVGDWTGVEYVDVYGTIYSLPHTWTGTYDDGSSMTVSNGFELHVDEETALFTDFTTYTGSDGSYDREQGQEIAIWDRLEKGRYLLTFPNDLAVECTLDDGEVTCVDDNGAETVFAPDED